MDVRGSYCAMAIASLLCLTAITQDMDWKRQVAEFIVKCQTYEGGIAGEVGESCGNKMVVPRKKGVVVCTH